MREFASREHRNITKEEIIASKFPTIQMCPNCWLDSNLEAFDPDEVSLFLKRWYWPEHDKAIPNKAAHFSITSNSPLKLSLLCAVFLLTVGMGNKKMRMKLLSLQRRKDMKNI